MRFVDGEERGRRTGEQLAEMGLAGTFGGDVEQIKLAAAEALDGKLAVHVDAGERSGGETIGVRRAQLIVHERDERGHDHAGAREHRGRELVGERFAGACRHDRKGRPAR